MQQIIQHGIDLLARAGDDKDLLGMSLIYLHSGLEAHFRDQLEPEATLFREREQKHPAWPDLIDLWDKKFGLSERHRDILSGYNTLRNSVAHAKPHELSRIELQRYANFVQNFVQADGVAKDSVVMGTAVPPQPTQISQTTPAQPRHRSSSFWQDGRLAWLIPLFALFLVLMGFVWALTQAQPGSTNNLFGFNRNGSEALLPPTVAFNSPELLPAFLDQTNFSPTPTSPTIIVILPNPNQKIRITAQTDIHTGPGAQYQRLTLAPGNARYTILEVSSDGGWYKVQLEPGITGWLSAAQTEIVAP